MAGRNDTDSIRCPDCGSGEYIKNGKAKGKQIYLCKSCYSRFSLDRKKPRYPAEIKKEAVFLYRQGLTLTQIAWKLNVNVQTIYYWIKTYSD